VRANAEAAAKDFYNSNITVEGTFKSVRLKPGVVASMWAVDAPARLSACSNWLKADKNNKFINGLTGVVLKTATISTDRDANIRSKLIAGLSGVLSAAKIADLDAEWTKQINSWGNASTAPYFQVLSISGQKVP
jgi:hypothetical protein